MHWEKVSLCAVPRCSPNHIRANESIPPPVMAAPARGPRKEREEGGEGGRVAGGLRYEGRGEENDRTENGRWWKGVACWVALMMSEGYRKGEQKAHSEGKKSGGHITEELKEEEEGRSPTVSREKEG